MKKRTKTNEEEKGSVGSAYRAPLAFLLNMGQVTFPRSSFSSSSSSSRSSTSSSPYPSSSLHQEGDTMATPLPRQEHCATITQQMHRTAWRIFVTNESRENIARPAPRLSMKSTICHPHPSTLRGIPITTFYGIAEA